MWVPGKLGPIYDHSKLWQTLKIYFQPILGVINAPSP